MKAKFYCSNRAWAKPYQNLSDAYFDNYREAESIHQLLDEFTHEMIEQASLEELDVDDRILCHEIAENLQSHHYTIITISNEEIAVVIDSINVWSPKYAD